MKRAVWFWAIAIVGMVLSLGVSVLGQEQERQDVYYEVVRVGCQLPDGCELTLQTMGTGRPLTLRCRNGCVVMRQDTVAAQTTLRAIVFDARPDSGVP